jgi:hypothetical protein
LESRTATAPATGVTWGNSAASEADAGGVLLGQHGLAGVQPAALACVTKQGGQFALMRLLDPVQVE